MRTLLLSIALAVASPQALAEPASETTPATPITLDELRRVIQNALAADSVPGASVVVIEQGKVVFSQSYGVADVATGRRVDKDTIFRAGSISKSLTAIGVMRLVEQGRLALESPVETLLPEWRVHNAWRDIHPVRVGHLLEHTAGLDDIRFRHYLIEGRGITLEQALPLFGPYKLRWAPGHGTAYSNAGPIVAGRIIEKASGQDFEQFMAATITEPMGMRTARWGRDPAQADQLATSYQQDGRTPEPFVETPGRPSGSLSATAADLARLPLLLLGQGEIDGYRLLSELAVKRLETPLTSFAAANGAPIGLGLGLRMDPNGRAVFYGHDGSIDGFVARFAYSPELRSGYVVMANKASDAALDAAAHIRRYLERQLPQAPIVAKPVSDAQRAAWAGQYQSTTPRQELLRAVIGLTQWEGAVFEGDTLQFEQARWQHRGNGLFQRVDAVAPGLLFIDSPSGTTIHTTDGTKRRVPGWEMTAKISILATVAISLLTSIALLPFWLRSRMKGTLAARGGAAIRFAPLIGLACAALVPFSVLVLLSTGDLNVVGRPNFWGYAVWLLSVAAPLIVVVAASVVWRQRFIGRSASRGTQWHAVCQLLLAVIVIGWLFAHGWIGIRIWDA
jgi:CubicO group peptidase (beta-lactamase class C family)